MTAIDRTHDYWQAEGIVNRGLASFETALEAGDTARQRSVFYRLAKYQARTLHIFHSALDSHNEELAQATLHNLGALQRTMQHIHAQAPEQVPLPFLIREEVREELASDLVMRVLREAGAPLTLGVIAERVRHRRMLGPIRAGELEDNLERLVGAGHVAANGERFAATALSYTELDLNTRGLRAMLTPAVYERMVAGGFRRLGAVVARPRQFEQLFAEATGFVDPETYHLFEDTADLVVRHGLGEMRPWSFRDITATGIPRPYQREAYRVFTRGAYRSQIIEAPTGSGKTLIGMMSIGDGLRVLLPGRSILVLVPTAAYQQQWLAELCFHDIGLGLSPEIVFAGTPSQLDAWIRHTGQHPPIVLLTYTSLSQLASPAGKGGFDADSLETFLQQANIQYVLLDEVHKVVADMHSVSTDVTRLLVEWRDDDSLRALIGFSGTAESYRNRFATLGLDLVHTIPMDDLVAAGFVAPFTELGVPFSNSARERGIRRQLDALKEELRGWLELLGGERLRAWFATLPMAERVRIGHELLGMYRGRHDWEAALEARFREWEQGGELKLTEINLVLIVQLAERLSDADLAEQAGLDPAQVAQLRERLEALRTSLLELIYLPETMEQLQRQGLMTTLDSAALDAAAAAPSWQRRIDGTRDALVTTVAGLYAVLRGWYLRVGEGRVETIKAVIEAERELREVSGTIVFDVGRRIHWRGGLATPGYEGVGGLFSQMLGDQRFTVMAALSSEIYLSYDDRAPLTRAIADFIEDTLLRGEASEAILDLATQGLGIDDDVRERIAELFHERIAAYVPSLRSIRAPRPGSFQHKVIEPVRGLVREMELGDDGERILARLRARNEHLRGLVRTFFDYAMIAHSFRDARVAELEQVSGARQRFFVVPMPGSSERKQLMYEMTSRVVDADSLPVNLIIVSSWARTGWNVITPNVLIDATATADVTAWQQLRGRAIRARRSWTNDCYRLEALLLDQDPMRFADDGEDDGTHEDQLDEALLGILREVASRRQRSRVLNEGFGALSERERHGLATRLMRHYNKVTHVYELVKAFGSTSQVTLDRRTGHWRRKDAIAAKHHREVAVDPIHGRKSHDQAHAPLLYVADPRADLPADVGAKLVSDLDGADDRIIGGWLDPNG